MYGLLHVISGGCAANAYHATGSLSGLYEIGCKLMRKLSLNVRCGRQAGDESGGLTGVNVSSVGRIRMNSG